MQHSNKIKIARGIGFFSYTTSGCCCCYRNKSRFDRILYNNNERNPLLLSIFKIPKRKRNNKLGSDIE